MEMSKELKAFYLSELLANARVEMFYAQFAKLQPLPEGHGKDMEWRKWNTFQNAPRYMEGFFPTGQKYGMSRRAGRINAYEDKRPVGEPIEMNAYDPVILGATEELGASLAKKIEVLLRDGLLSNPNVLYCDNVDKLTGEVKGATPTACNQLGADDSAGWALLTDQMVNKAVTKLKKDKVPRIHGKYYAVIHPSVAEGLRSCEGWRDAHRYAEPGEIMNGEIGELHGCRFIEDVFAPVLGGKGYTNKKSGVTYATYFFGKNAMATADPDGGAVKMQCKNLKGGCSEIGYALETNGCTVLYPERVIRVMSTSLYASSDKANY